MKSTPKLNLMVSRFIRRYQQPLLIVFTVLIIISFVGFFDRSGYLEKMGHDQAATIYDRPVSQVQLQRAARFYELARRLQMNDLVKALCAVHGIPEEMLSMYQLPERYESEFPWNLFVLRHEAEQLGITSTQAERDEVITQMPVFQSKGAFDGNVLNMFLTNGLGSLGLTGEAFEELVGDQITLRKLLALLGATTAPAPGDVRAAYDQYYEKTGASVVRWKLDDFLATATAPEEEVKKLYEARKEQLKSDEKRKVKVAAFILPTTDQPLEGKARAEALDKLARAAEEFSLAMAEKDADFEAAAAKAGVKVEETAEFARGEAPPALGGSPAVAAGAYKVTMKQPVSEVLNTDRGYYVLQLTGVSEVRPLTYEEARPQLAEQLKRERAQEALGLKAAEVRAKIDTALKAGQSFADAAATAGVKAETIPPFSRSEPIRTMPDANEIMTATSGLKEGALSPFTPSATGGLLVRVDKRVPADDAKFATDQILISNGISRQAREAIFAEWLKLRRAEARVMVPKRG